MNETPRMMPDAAPAVLAYLGDAVFELYVREALVRAGVSATSRALHRRTTALVCAPAQARMAHALADFLTPEEATVLRRGRNAHTGRIPAGATVGEYRYATGFEALLGYLYLRDQTERIREIVAAAMRAMDIAP